MPDTRRADTPTEVYSGPGVTAPYPQAAVPDPQAAVPVSGTGHALGGGNDALIGTVLSGTYTVLRRLGEGGMGRVYEAQHTRIAGKRYAIKVLHPEHALNADVRARFQREAEAAAAINHANVVGVYDVNVLPDGRPFMVSELLRGRELGEYLDAQGRLTAPEAVAIVRQVCDALDAAHQCGVIHRDVKPENVFLTGSPERPLVKVLDFGISRLEGQGGQKLTRTGMVMGTPCYMAPEQARGEVADRRTDMYATGAILYRALGGRRPFERTDTMATLGAVLTEEPARLRAMAPDVPPPLELIVQRAMAREPQARYQQMRELSEALSPYDVLPPVRLGSARAPSLPGNQLRAGEAEMARPRLVMLLCAASAGVLLGLMSMVAAVIELWGGRSLSGIEAALVVVGSVGVLATPLWLLVRWLARSHWHNTAKVLGLSRALRAPVLLGLASSGMLALSVRTLEPLLLRNSLGLSWPVWGLVIPFGGVLAALVGVAESGLAERADPRGAAARFFRPRLFAVAAIAAMLLLGFGLVVRDDPARRATQPLVREAGADASGVEFPRVRFPSRSNANGGGAKRLDDAKGSAKNAKPTAYARQLLVQLREQNHRGDLAASLNTLDKLNKASPRLMSEPAARALVVEVAVKAYSERGARAQRMTRVLRDDMADNGRRVMFELMATHAGTVASHNATGLLADPAVQAKCSEDLRVAYALHVANDCASKVALVSRAAREGGALTLRELKAMRACGGGGCCLSKSDNKAVLAALQRIKQRDAD